MAVFPYRYLGNPEGCPAGPVCLDLPKWGGNPKNLNKAFYLTFTGRSGVTEKYLIGVSHYS